MSETPKSNPWLYIQSTGELFRPDGDLCSTGYSGTQSGRNNPALQNVKNIGPIPVGVYTLGAVTAHKGPITIQLIPEWGNVMHDRGGFLVHGDNHENDASEGCIIMPRAARLELQKGGSIRVIAKPTAFDKPSQVA